jgi:hypothetical protein
MTTTTRPSRYTPEVLAAAVAMSTNMREVLDQLNVPRTGGSHAHVARRIKALDIDASHFTARRAEPPPLQEFSRAELASAFAQARSMADLARHLKLPVTSRTCKHLARQLAASHLDPSQLGHQRLVLNHEDLRRAAEHCTSLIGVIRALGLEETNSNVRRARRALDAYKIDTSHFVRVPWRKPDPRPSRLTTRSTLLRQQPTGAARTGGERLRRALLATGVAERCRECGVGGQWRGRPLTLEVDHINGDWHDNRPDNLRLLCPNCHATTTTYCRQKKPIS